MGRDPHAACPSAQAARRGWPRLGGIALCSAGTASAGARPAVGCYYGAGARPGGSVPPQRCRSLRRRHPSRHRPLQRARFTSAAPVPAVSPAVEPRARLQPPRTTAPHPGPARPALDAAAPTCCCRAGTCGAAAPLRSVRRLLGPQLPAARAGGARAAPAGTAPGGTACGPRATHRPPGPALRCGRPRPSPRPRAPAPQPPHRATGCAGAAAGGDGGRSNGDGAAAVRMQGGRMGVPAPRIVQALQKGRRSETQRCEAPGMRASRVEAMPPAGIQGAGEAAGGLQEPLLPDVVGVRDEGSLGRRGCCVAAPLGTRVPGGCAAPGAHSQLCPCG